MMITQSIFRVNSKMRVNKNEKKLMVYVIKFYWALFGKAK